MRKIEATTRFKRDYGREKSGRLGVICLGAGVPFGGA
jgi:hypothetical protein